MTLAGVIGMMGAVLSSDIEVTGDFHAAARS